VARTPTLSPTKLSTYLACPLKYRWTYLDTRGRWYLKSKSYYSFGSTLHKVLQRFHDSGDSGVQSIDHVLPALEESWLDEGYSSGEEMQQAFGEGKEILTRYVADELQRPQRAKTIFVEKSLRTHFEGFDLVGRIDRLDEHDAGTLEIIDYKTGRESVRSEDVQSDLAMACYALMVRETYPSHRVLATIVAVRSGISATYEYSSSEAAEFRSDLQILGNEIFAKNWEEVRATGKKICPACDFLKLCRQDAEFSIPDADLISGVAP
jgi:putative RecB family exonuclease